VLDDGVEFDLDVFARSDQPAVTFHACSVFCTGFSQRRSRNLRND
jgi:hypothetical protein